MINILIEASKKGELPFLDSAATKDVSVRAAEKVHELVQKHFRNLPGRDFYKQAAADTDINTNASGADAEVTVNKPGVRLQRDGGTVRPTGRTSAATGNPIRSLLIPAKWSVLQDKDLSELPYPKDQIQVIPRKGKSALLALVLPQPKGQTGKRSKVSVLGFLVKSATITAHPEVFPTEDEIYTAAEKGAKQQLKRLLIS